LTQSFFKALLLTRGSYKEPLVYYYYDMQLKRIKQIPPFPRAFKLSEGKASKGSCPRAMETGQKRKRKKKKVPRSRAVGIYRLGKDFNKRNPYLLA